MCLHIQMDGPTTDRRNPPRRPHKTSFSELRIFNAKGLVKNLFAQIAFRFLIYLLPLFFRFFSLTFITYVGFYRHTYSTVKFFYRKLRFLVLL